MTVKDKHSSVAVIGGIRGSIGSSIADRLLRSGWCVAGIARDGNGNGESNGGRSVKLPSGAEVPVFSADMTKSDAVDSAFAAVAGQYEQLDAYIHAVGSVFLKAAHLTSDEELYTVLSTNLLSAFYSLRSAVKIMRRRKAGSLVYFSSVAAQIGLSQHEAIAAAKGGIDGMVRSAAATYAPLGIRINAVAPGLVETQATAALTGNANARELSERMHPLGRLGQPDEVASLVSWLVSEEASWVTGQIWSMDGGMGAIVPKPRA